MCASVLRSSYETNHWLLPSSGADSPWADFVLARTATANYTVANYDAFFADIGYGVGAIVHERVHKLLPRASEGPGVPVLCIYSTGVSTPLSFDYGDGDWAKTPVATMGDGDGTVNVRSLRVCEQWNTTQSQPVRVLTVQNVTHSGMLKDERVIQALLAATRAVE